MNPAAAEGGCGILKTAVIRTVHEVIYGRSSNRPEITSRLCVLEGLLRNWNKKQQMTVNVHRKVICGTGMRNYLCHIQRSTVNSARSALRM